MWSVLVYVQWACKKMCSVCCWMKYSICVCSILLVDGVVEFYSILTDFFPHVALIGIIGRKEQKLHYYWAIVKICGSLLSPPTLW